MSQEHTCSLRPARRQQDQSRGARQLPVDGYGISKRLHTVIGTLAMVDHTETAADCTRGWKHTLCKELSWLQEEVKQPDWTASTGPLLSMQCSGHLN